MADPVDSALAKEQFEFEKKKWQDELDVRRSETALKQAEMEAKRKEQSALRVLIPIAAAVVGAILAGAGNVVVETTKAKRELILETQKEQDAHTMQGDKARLDSELEREKAEATRIASAIKDDPDQTKKNLQLLIDLNLISNKDLAAKLESYFKSRPGGQGAGAVPGPIAKEPDTPAHPESEQTRDIVRFQSGWLGGGHNQNDECEKGRQILLAKYPGKTLKLLSSDEQNNKDFFGHVTYNYGCVFQVS
jgi:hypothetical protein